MTPLSRAARWLWHQPYLLVALTTLLWSGNIVTARGAADVVPPLTLAQVRWTGAFLIVLPFAWQALKREWPLIRQHFWILTVLSFSGITAYNSIAYWGLQHTEAINGSLLQSATPVLIAFWSLVLYRDPLTRNQATGIVISAVGVVAIVTRGDPTALAELRFNQGDIAFFVALSIYALYTAALRSRPAISAVSLIAVTTGWGAAMHIPAWLFEFAVQGRTITPDPVAWFALGYVVLFPSVIAYFAYNRGVDLVGANRAAPAYFLFPVYGAILSITFLGETIQGYHLVGSALVLAGVAVSILRPRKRRPDPAGE